MYGANADLLTLQKPYGKHQCISHGAIPSDNIDSKQFLRSTLGKALGPPHVQHHMRKLAPMTATIRTIAAMLAFASASVSAQPATPGGEVKGDAWVHSKDSLAATVQQADVCLPPAATGGSSYCGKFKDIPKLSGRQVPVVLFLHGSSGLGLKAIGDGNYGSQALVTPASPRTRLRWPVM